MSVGVPTTQPRRSFARQADRRSGADRLVGRDDELASIDRALDELDGGRGGALEITGEPGIGKTRLLKELAARADARGHLVLSGAASELERDLPFSLFVDALDEFLGGLEPERLAELDGDVLAELTQVFPSLAPLAPGREATPQHERYRTHRAVRALLSRLAERTPLVLVLDDLHWADPASVELLGALLRRPPAAAVLVSLALRPRQLPERLAPTLERSRRDGTLTSIELVALTPDEARALLGGTVGVAELAVLYRECGGNPFYLEQLARSPARALASSGATPPTALGVPPAVAASLTEEFALLSDRARFVLEGAAIAGDPARDGGRGRRDDRGRRDAGDRRAARARSRPRHRRPSALRLPAPADPAGGV
jgi:predicted ATPase